MANPSLSHFGGKVNPTTWANTVRTAPPYPPVGSGMMSPAPATRPGSVSAAASGMPGLKMGENSKKRKKTHQKKKKKGGEKV